MLIFAIAVAALKLRTAIPCPVTARTRQLVLPVPLILLPIILYPSGIKSLGNAIVTSLLPEMLVLEETKSFTINFSFCIFSINASKFLFCSDPSWCSNLPTYHPHRHNKHTRLSRVLYPSMNLQIYDAKYILCSALTLCWSTVQ